MIETRAFSQRTFLLTAFLLWAGHFCVDLMIGIWPVYKTMMHLDLAKAGLISTGCALAGEGLQVFFGSLSDKGYRKLLIISGVLTTAASTLLAYTEDYFLLFILFFFTCMGSGAFHPCAASWMGELSPNRKGLLITIFASGGYLGMALSQIIFSNTFYFFEGHTFILAIPLIGLAIFFGLSRRLASAPKTAESSQKKMDIRIFKDFFRRKDLTLLYISQVCNQSVLWALIFLLPDILSYREYDSWISLGGGHLFFVIGGFLMLIPAGHLADKYSCRTVILWATVIGIFLFYTFLMTPLMPTPLLFIVLFCLGAALGVVNPVAIALGTRLVPENPGMISAFLMGLVWCVSEGIGQGGGGLLTKLFEDDAPAKALGVLGAAFIVGLAATLKLPRETYAQKTSQQQN